MTAPPRFDDLPRPAEDPTGLPLAWGVWGPDDQVGTLNRITDATVAEAREEIRSGRRFNLQETVCREIYDLIAGRDGVAALSVSTCKPDIYPDCAGVGVYLASF